MQKRVKGGTIVGWFEEKPAAEEPKKPAKKTAKKTEKK